MCSAKLAALVAVVAVIVVIIVVVHRCLQSKAPKYLTDCCTPVSDIASRRHLHSASRHHLSVPSHRLSTVSRRAFSCFGPDDLELFTRESRDPAHLSGSFRQLLKTDLNRNAPFMQDVDVGESSVDPVLSNVDALHSDYLHTRLILRTTCRLHAGRRCWAVRGRRWTVQRRRRACTLPSQ